MEYSDNPNVCEHGAKEEHWPEVRRFVLPLRHISYHYEKFVPFLIYGLFIFKRLELNTINYILN